MCPSAAVIVSSGPIGAAPCETHGRISTPSSRTPTAPPSTTSSPKNSAGASSDVRAEAIPPSSGSSGDASQRKRSTASVGNENGSASRIAPAAPSRSGSPDSAPEPSSISSTVAWNGSTSPSPSDAAHTETAVPSSTSRASEITPPAPQPTSVIGLSISWTAASVASGAARCAPEANRTARSHGRPLSPRAAAEAASSAPARASGVVDRPVAMWTLTRLTILRAVRVIAIFGPTGVGKTEVAIALARAAPRATARTPWRSSADAMQVYDGLPILSGAATPERAGAARAPPARLRARRRSRSAPVPTPRRAHAEIDAALAAGAAPDRRRRHRPLPARRAGRRSTCARPRPRRARGGRRSSPRSGRRRCTPSWPSARPRSPRASGPSDGRRIVRTLELLDAGVEPPVAAGGDSSCGRPTRATRRCSPAW